MHRALRALERAASRYAPSRTLSFDTVHIFIALQCMHKQGKASRQSLCNDLALGEGAVKTVIKHMKMSGMISTTNGGTKMTQKGNAIFSDLQAVMPAELGLPKCSVALGKYNYGVILRELAYLVRSGIEQRDAALKMGATGATTLVFRDGRFVMPASSQDSLRREREIRKLLTQALEPDEDDVIIIGSADASEKSAELGAKNAALFTLDSAMNR